MTQTKRRRPWIAQLLAMTIAMTIAVLSGCDEPPVTGDDLDASLSCGQGQRVCEGLCVSVSNSSEHCGACGNACGAGETCESGICQAACPGEFELCDGACRDVNVDPQNCGGCGVVCEAG